MTPSSPEVTIDVHEAPLSRLRRRCWTPSATVLALMIETTRATSPRRAATTASLSDCPSESSPQHNQRDHSYTVTMTTQHQAGHGRAGRDAYGDTVGSLRLAAAAQCAF